MVVYTNISYGYGSLLEIFFKANDLEVAIEDRTGYEYPGHAILHYEDDSDTAYGITFLSIRHLGFENMLCDYLMRCGIPAQLIPIGSVGVKRDMKELDRQWEEHRKLIGLR